MGPNPLSLDVDFPFVDFLFKKFCQHRGVFFSLLTLLLTLFFFLK